MDREEIRTLRIMEEIERDNTISQRTLSQKIDISVGLVNRFIKRLVEKGYFKATTIPSHRVKYMLTPKGIAEKTRLTYEYLRYSLRFYRELKDSLQEVLSEIRVDGIDNILLYGTGEIAELAVLFSRVNEIEIVGIVDDRAGGLCLEMKISPLSEIRDFSFDAILILHTEEVKERISSLSELGVEKSKIYTLKRKR
ncbi:MAG: winged helix-turn-helix transcriptional regulator [Deltaproteobacteria bacterium]|uniref:Winged helix-turn-helix transcriptional regulator n=1 Tax=Candidatus Zymogenus saltonus TaxID=2844893 RepID=A0A9D8KBY0_9DELT|nr:winged helix-turn-helix transcriptional regulator [Candidatus Zymogenus saltonus]